MKLRLPEPTRLLMRHARHHRLLFGAGLALLLVGVTGCKIDSTNTYPIDIFSGMHYQESYKSHEPPRLQNPDGIVPISGRDPMYTQQELTEMENPLEPTDEVIARGKHLFEVNCQFCHGPGAQGDGPIAGYFQNAKDARPPANLTQDRLVNVKDGYIYSVVKNGFGQWMPSFGNLLPGDDVWSIIQYIRTLQQQAGGQ